MKYTLGTTQREREAKFTVSDFLYANEGIIGNMYLEEYPTEGHAINDGDYSNSTEWASTDRREYFIEIMKDIYLDNIGG